MFWMSLIGQVRGLAADEIPRVRTKTTHTISQISSLLNTSLQIKEKISVMDFQHRSAAPSALFMN